MLVLSAAVLLTGCHADVAAFRVSVADGEQEYTLSLRDETRRPYEEEDIVSDELDEAPRFRIEEIPEEIEDVPIVTLEVELNGDYHGGTVQIDGAADYTASYAQAVDLAPGTLSEGSAEAVVLRFSLGQQRPPLRAAELRGAELIFTADAGQAYTIEEIRFLTEIPPLQVTFPGSSTPAVFDDRLPVAGDEGEWHVPDISYVTGERSDGLQLRYRMAEDQFVDRTDRPRVMLDLHGREAEVRSLELDLRPGTRDVVVRPGLWQDDTESLTVRGGPGGFELQHIVGSTIPETPSTPIPVELSELLRFPADEWRRDEFELFTWTL
ncbi:MAG: hypothetical protein ACOCU4_05585, partial [Alkalispirochaeta sp.]